MTLRSILAASLLLLPLLATAHNFVDGQRGGARWRRGSGKAYSG